MCGGNNKHMSKLGHTLLMAAMAMGGGLPGIKTPQSNTSMRELPEGFREWLFDRDTGELINDEYMKNHNSNTVEKEINIFAVTARSEENARKEFERLTKVKSI